MNIKNTIAKTADHLDYLKKQVALTELKLKNLTEIQNQGNLTTAEEKKVYVCNILQMARKRDLVGLQNLLDY